MEGRTATLNLGGSYPTSVRVFDLGAPSARLAVTTRSPYKLYSDLDGDGRIEPGEINGNAASKTYALPEFDNVRVALPVGDTTVLLWMTCSLRGDRLYYSHNDVGYGGALTIAGREYPAWLAVDTLGATPGTTLMLDTNGDGRFLHDDDLWCSAPGFAWLDGGAWTVSAALHGTTAEVALERFTGATGTLQLAGTDLRRVYVTGKVRLATGWPADHCTFVLPTDGTAAFALPSGSYQVEAAQLGADVPDATRYQLLNARMIQGIGLRPGATEEIALGGPLREYVKVSRRPLSGRIRLDYQGLRNSAGYPYEKTRGRSSSASPTAARVAVSSDAPGYEVLDGRGNVVASGSFQYG